MFLSIPTLLWWFDQTGINICISALIRMITAKNFETLRLVGLQGFTQAILNCRNINLT